MAPDPRDAGVDELRLPPHSLEAEQAVLGALMISAEAWERVGDRVALEDFYSTAHRTIFAALVDLARKALPCDVVSTAESLSRRGELDAVGGLPYLGALAQSVPSIANAAHYAGIVRDRAQLRALAALAIELSDLAYSRGGHSAAELIDQAQRRVEAISQAGATDDPKPIGAFLDDVVTYVEERNEKGPESLVGLSTGLSDLDRMTLGLQPGEVYVVAGRPSMGKSALAYQIAVDVSVRLAIPALCFSMEMRARQLAMRAIANVGHVDTHALRSGAMIGDDWTRVSNALGKLNDAPLLIDGTTGLSIERLRARAKRMHRRSKLGLIVVDYLQLMETGPADNRTQAIGDISRGAKLLAMELEVPIILLSQLNRSLESRTNKRPMMSDLRDSGAIEQDADAIIFIYRDEVYHPDKEDSKGKAELIIAKQREGAIGTVYCSWVGKYTRFADTSWRPQESGPQATGAGWES